MTEKLRKMNFRSFSIYAGYWGLVYCVGSLSRQILASLLTFIYFGMSRWNLKAYQVLAMPSTLSTTPVI